MLKTNSSSLDLTKISNEEILSRLERLAKSERKITHLILWHLLEVESRKLYLKIGFDSLYRYLTQHLGHSESAAYDRIQAARLLKKAPGIAEKIEDGSLNLTQLVKVEQGLKQEKRLGQQVSPSQIAELVQKIENKTSFETEKIIACELNQTPKAYQKVKPQSDDSVRLELTLTSEQYEILKRAQNYISHIIPDNDLAAVVTYLAKSLIQKKEGKAQKPQTMSETANQNSSGKDLTRSFGVTPSANSGGPKQYKRQYISIRIRRQVFTKANYSCEHVNPQSKGRCRSKYQLQVDHKIPVARGGTNKIENLRALCGTHNRQEALRWGLIRPDSLM